MSFEVNGINNNNLAELSRQAGPRVMNAIKSASAKTGVNFAYLVEKAAAESSFQTNAKSKSSSATGLFQFIDSTWLKMVKTYGAKYGMGKYADCIDDKGCVKDPAMKQEILSLRNNPEKASMMAAEFASENQRYLQSHVKDGIEVGSTELYLAHFMGAGGATAFLNAMKDDPLATGADYFPKASRANHNVFYDQGTGKPRTLAGIYDFFDKKFSGSNEPANETAVANNTVSAPVSNTSAISSQSMARLILEQQTIQEFANSDNQSGLRYHQVEDIIWNGPRHVVAHARSMSLSDVLLMAQMDAPTSYKTTHNSSRRYNS